VSVSLCCFTLDVLAYSRCSGESGTERDSCPISLLSLLGSEAERWEGGRERARGRGDGERGGKEGGKESCDAQQGTMYHLYGPVDDTDRMIHSALLSIT
jgi:hypothetical protein